MLLYLHRNETDSKETDHDYVLLVGDPNKKVVVGTGTSMFDKDVLIRLDEEKLVEKIKEIFGD